jgi:uncharacterized protein YbaR (Trm112 family)
LTDGVVEMILEWNGAGFRRKLLQQKGGAMAKCPSCNKQNPDNFKFCLDCGTELDKMQQQQGRQYLTFSALSSCRHCGGGLPLQGPRRSVRCAACQGENDFQADQMADLLHYASRRSRVLIGGGLEMKYQYAEEHRCPGCGTPIDIRAIPVGEERVTPCPKCGAPIASYPPPAWLKNELPGLLMIIGGERDPADVPAAGEGAQAVAVPKKSSPVVLACPSCKASLKVDSDTARTTTCQFCNESVYLPDDLWRVLHPVRRAEGWSIVYDGALERRYDIEKREREAAEKAREKAEQIMQDFSVTLPPSSWSDEKSKGAEVKERSVLVPLMIVVAVVGILLAIIVPMFARGCAGG